jgi:hypothetical protein
LAEFDSLPTELAPISAVLTSRPRLTSKDRAVDHTSGRDALPRAKSHPCRRSHRPLHADRTQYYFSTNSNCSTTNSNDWKNRVRRTVGYVPRLYRITGVPAVYPRTIEARQELRVRRLYALCRVVSLGSQHRRPSLRQVRPSSLAQIPKLMASGKRILHEVVVFKKARSEADLHKKLQAR